MVNTRTKWTRTAHERRAERRSLTLAARLTWKDASGAVRFAPVVLRDVSEAGAFVECQAPAAIPLYRLVHLQVERGVTDPALPAVLAEGRVLSAIWRVAPCRRTTGTPSGYALRFLIDRRAAERSARTMPQAGVAIAS